MIKKVSAGMEYTKCDYVVSQKNLL